MNHSQPYSDQELVALLKRREQAAFTYLYDNYSAALHGVIQNIIPDQNQSLDVLQEVFLKIWRQIEQYDTAKGRLFTWMHNIAKNTAIDLLRSKGWQKGKVTDQLENINLGTSNATTPHTDGIGVMGLVQTLKDEYRTLLQLAYGQGFTQEEIARMLNIPLGTVKTRMRAALVQLRKNFSLEK